MGVVLNKTKNIIQCEFYGCKERAAYDIGNPKFPATVYKLCKTHIMQLIEDLKDEELIVLDSEAPAEEPEITDADLIREEILEAALNANNLTINKDVLVEIAAKYNIEIDESESKTKILEKLLEV
ncbi:MAG: hypothetical protein PWP27_206 [Clostridiales bacterium]|jgi:hypothetical protein|nr:hypothetical protein [Clostridiales bacterium]